MAAAAMAAAAAAAVAPAAEGKASAWAVETFPALDLRLVRTQSPAPPPPHPPYNDFKAAGSRGKLGEKVPGSVLYF